jgi:dTDP-4-dehydrorhamnose 3,5-epimerase
MSAEYIPDLARGVRHDDPQTGISWPLPVAQVSERDASLPLLRELPAA